MPNYANAYGAIGGGDALRQILTDKLTAQKVAEDNRRAQVAEAADAAQRAQAAEQFRAQQAMQMTQFTTGRDERYQDRMADVAAKNQALQSATSERELARKADLDERAARAAERETDHAFTAGENEKGRALQRHIAGQRAPVDTEGRTLDHELTRMKIEAEKAKAATVAAAPPDTFASELDALTGKIYGHKGMGSAGTGFNIGRSYNTEFGNLSSLGKQLRSLYLNDPDVKAKIAAMKPASNVDIENALRAAINFDPDTMDAASLRAEIDRVRGKVGLKGLGAAPAGGGDGSVYMKGAGWD